MPLDNLGEGAHTDIKALGKELHSASLHIQMAATKTILPEVPLSVSNYGERKTATVNLSPVSQCQ